MHSLTPLRPDGVSARRQASMCPTSIPGPDWRPVFRHHRKGPLPDAFGHLSPVDAFGCRARAFVPCGCSLRLRSLCPRWRVHAASRALCLTGVSLHVQGDLSRRPRHCRHCQVCGLLPMSPDVTRRRAPPGEHTRPPNALQALHAPLNPAAMGSRAPTSPTA